MGLTLLSVFEGEAVNLTASIIAFDLNTGEIAEFGDFTPDESQFQESIKRAKLIMDAVNEGNPMHVDCEPL